MLYLLMSFPAAVAGVVFLAIAARRHRRLIELRRRATARADARVAWKVSPSSGSPGGRVPNFYAYEFMVNGAMRRGEFPGSRCLKAGDAVTLFCDPECPERIYIPQYWHSGGLPGLYFIGGCWTLMGVLMFIFWLLGVR